MNSDGIATSPSCVIPGLDRYARERAEAMPGLIDGRVRFECDYIIDDAAGESGACE